MATVDKSGSRVRQMFGEIAGRYDFLNHLLSLNVDRYWRWRTVRSVPPVAGGNVLDVSYVCSVMDRRGHTELAFEVRAAYKKRFPKRTQ